MRVLSTPHWGREEERRGEGGRKERGLRERASLGMSGYTANFTLNTGFNKGKRLMRMVHVFIGDAYTRNSHECRTWQSKLLIPQTCRFIVHLQDV